MAALNSKNINPFTRVLLNINTAVTTVSVAAVASQTVKVYRIFLNMESGQTVDFQDTSNVTLSGGPITNGIVLDYVNNLWFVTDSGKGFQLVTTTTGRVTGFIDYLQS